MRDEIGKRIKKRRKEKGMTLQQLGRSVKYDYSNLSKIERGEYEASYELLQNLANALNVKMSYFFGEEPEIPQELKDMDVEWIALTNELKKDNLTPEEVKRYVRIVKQLKDET